LATVRSLLLEYGRKSTVKFHEKRQLFLAIFFLIQGIKHFTWLYLI